MKFFSFNTLAAVLLYTGTVFALYRGQKTAIDEGAERMEYEK